MITIGIDPGVARVGYGVLQHEGDRILAQKHGCIETPAGMVHGERLLIIHTELLRIFSYYKPATVAVEKLFFQTNVTTALSVGEGRGVVLLAAASLKIPVVEMTPLQVKQSVAGYGKADKRAVQEMVMRLLNLKEIPKPDDAADALAIALTGMRLRRLG